MELLDLFIVLIPIVLVFLVRFVFYNHPFEEEHIRKTQLELDEISYFVKEQFRKDIHYDAKNELIFYRFEIKGFVLIIFGIIMAILSGLFFKNGYLDHLFSLTVSAIFLISYGLSLANRQKYLPAIIFIAFLGLLFFLIYHFNLYGLEENFQSMKVYSFILILGFLFFLIIPRVEKEDKKDNKEK